jgi:hypothetical protein
METSLVFGKSVKAFPPPSYRIEHSLLTGHFAKRFFAEAFTASQAF